VVQDFVPEGPGEVALVRDNVILILEQNANGWWKGDVNGKVLKV
jgi:hypothetical protein